MYEFAYTEITDGSAEELRARERHAMSEVIRLMRIAKEKGPGTVEEVDALFYLRRLWTIFTGDLSKAENELPAEIRANLLSIGGWMLKEIERVRSGSLSDLTPMIEINEIIRDGLR